MHSSRRISIGQFVAPALLALIWALAAESLAKPNAAIPKSAAMPPNFTYHSEDPYPNYKRARYMACRDSVFRQGKHYSTSGPAGTRRERHCYVSDNPVKFSVHDVLYNPVTHCEDGRAIRERGPDTPDHFPVNVLIVQHGYGGRNFVYCDTTDDFSTSEDGVCELNQALQRVVPTGYGKDDVGHSNFAELRRGLHRTGAYNNWGYQDSDNDGLNDDFVNVSLIPYLEEKVPGYPGKSILTGENPGALSCANPPFCATGAYYGDDPDNQSGFDKNRWVVLPITLDINPGGLYLGILPPFGAPVAVPTSHNERGLATVQNGKRLRLLMDNLWAYYKAWIDTVSFIGHSTGPAVIKSMLQERRTPTQQAAYLEDHEWILYTDDMIGIAPGYGGTPTVFCDPSNDDLKITLGGGIMDERDFESWSNADQSRYWTPSDLLSSGREKRTAAWPSHLNVLSVVGVFRHPDGLYNVSVPVVGGIKCPDLEGEDDSQRNFADGDPLAGRVEAKAPVNHHGFDPGADDKRWHLGKFDGGMGSFSAFEGTSYCSATDSAPCKNFQDQMVEFRPQTALPTVVYNDSTTEGDRARNLVIGNRNWVLHAGRRVRSTDAISKANEGDGYMKRMDLERINRDIPVTSPRPTNGRKANVYVEVDGASHLGLLHNESVLYLAKRWLANSTTMPHFRTVSSRPNTIDNRVFSYSWEGRGIVDADGPWSYRQYRFNQLRGAGSLGPVRPEIVNLPLTPVGNARATAVTKIVNE